jgi:hypothetical protein
VEGKEIEEVEEVKVLRGRGMAGAGDDKTKAKRVFTGHDTKDYRNCQYIKLA